MASASGHDRCPKTSVLIHGMNHAPEIAGIGPYTGQIAHFLAAQGHEVSVITTPPHYPGWRIAQGYRNGWRREQRDGVEVFRCPLALPRRVGGLSRIAPSLTFAVSSAPVAVWRILARRPQVVLVVEPTLLAAPATIAAARLVGARLVLHVQDLEVDAAIAVGHLVAGPIGAMARGLDRFIKRRFDHIITISDRMAERIAAKGVPAERIHMVRNWVDTDSIRPVVGASPYRGELGLPDDTFVCLYSGNLGAKQGLELVVEAADRLAHRTDVRFVVAGDGPMRSMLDAAALRLPNLTLLPFQPSERLSDFLALADLHLLPQQRDAADLLLPSKLGGMLASGRRILVTADPGTELAEFLGDAVVRTPPGDAQAMAAGIETAAATADSRRDARQSLAARLSRHALIHAFERALLDDVLSVADASDLTAPWAEDALRG